MPLLPLLPRLPAAGLGSNPIRTSSPSLQRQDRSFRAGPLLVSPWRPTKRRWSVLITASPPLLHTRRPATVTPSFAPPPLPRARRPLRRCCWPSRTRWSQGRMVPAVETLRLGRERSTANPFAVFGEETHPRLWLPPRPARGTVNRCRTSLLPASDLCLPQLLALVLAAGLERMITTSKSMSLDQRSGGFTARRCSHHPHRRLGDPTRARGPLPELSLVHAIGGDM